MWIWHGDYWNRRQGLSRWVEMLNYTEQFISCIGDQFFFSRSCGALLNEA